VPGLPAFAALIALALGVGHAFAAPDAGTPDGDSAKAADGGGKDKKDGKEKTALVPTPAAPLKSRSEDGGADRRVHIISIDGTIDLGLAPFVDRALQDAAGAALVIFDVNTFGGRVDAAVKIRDKILATQVPTLAYVNPRAISAGALISLAADEIVFAPGGSMGAATPIQMGGDGQAKAVGEKMVSYMRSEMRTTAEAKGRRGDVAEAMVDAEIEVEGISEKGKLLTATTELAKQIGLAHDEARTIDEILEKIGLQHAQRVHPGANWAEKVARFLTDPVVSGLLMSLGFLALMIELYTPGLGIAGGIGILLLGMFFGGHMVVELAGWEEVVLFLMGVVALALEVFVVPGFGVAGVIGAGLILASLVMAMLGLPIDVSWDAGLVTSALGNVMISMTITMILMILAVRRMPESRFGRWLVLETRLGRTGNAVESGDSEYESHPAEWRELIGTRGAAATDLNLSGKMQTRDGRLLDVVSQLEYLDKGTPLRVVDVEGVRIVVVRDEEG
jgi:membrane-bound serine protease (ClpP class)